MLLKLKTLTLRNFLSIGNITQVIRLDTGHFTVVAGQNLDAATNENGNSRNGCGKTTIINALSYVLFNESLSNIRMENLINKENGKGMLVTLDFEVGEHSYRIERGRRPNIFRFLVDAKEVTSTSTPEDETQSKQATQEVINSTIRITPALFRHVLAITTYQVPFLRMPVAQQREVIEEVLGITLLSQKAAALRERLNGDDKKNITGTRHEIKQEEIRIQSIQEANNRLQKAIDAAKLKQQVWRERQDKRLRELEEQRDLFGRIDFDAEVDRFDQLEEYLRTTQELTTKQRELAGEVKALEGQIGHFLEKSDIHKGQIRQQPAQTHERDVQRYRRELSELEAQMQAAEGDRLGLLQQLETSDELRCSTCGQPLHDTDHLQQVVDQIKLQITTADEKLKRLAKRHNDVDAIIVDTIKRSEDDKTLLLESNSRHEEEIDKAEKQAISLAGALEELYEQVGEVKSSLESLGQRPETLFDSRDQLWQTKSAFDGLIGEIEEVKTAEDPYKDQVDSLVSSVQSVDYSVLNALVSKKEHEEFLLKMLTDKNSFIRKSIIEQNLAYLNHRLAMHLEKIGLIHQATFQSDLSMEITRYGKDLDFDNLSRGEQNRVLLSLAWAFRDLFENMHMPMNVMLIDEILDFGMDLQGAIDSMKVIREMYENRGKGVFLISNREELIKQSPHLLIAMKQNQFTTYEELEAA